MSSPLWDRRPACLKPYHSERIAFVLRECEALNIPGNEQCRVTDESWPAAAVRRQLPELISVSRLGRQKSSESYRTRGRGCDVNIRRRPICLSTMHT
jgi:hypothetical protein